MIKVSVDYRGSGFASLEVKGHANSGAFPHDLVCAAVSAVVTGACNAIEAGDAFHITLEDGHALIEAPAGVNEHDVTVLETLIIQLKTIEESNKGYLEIKERKN